MGLEKRRVLGGTVAVDDAFYYELSLSLDLYRLTKPLSLHINIYSLSLAI